jgi:hypothetical protein
MRRPKPKVNAQRSASGAFSLSRSLPSFKLPLGAAGQPGSARPKPKVGKPSPAGGVKGRRNE